MDKEKRLSILLCDNCLKSGEETFHQAFELKKTGLKIFKYNCSERSQAEYLDPQASMKKDYIILDNPSNNELRRPDFIKELCQYKTKCMCCRLLIKRVLRLLDAINEIKKREVIGVCEYCKRSSKIACKKCDYLINKYVEERKALEQGTLFHQWLKDLEHVLEAVSGDEEQYSDIFVGSALRRSRTREPHKQRKYIPKEFSYPPTSRFFFPDCGSPLVTQYPQPRDTVTSPSQFSDLSSRIDKSKFPNIILNKQESVHERLLKKSRYKSRTQSDHTEPFEISTISGITHQSNLKADVNNTFLETLKKHQDGAKRYSPIKSPTILDTSSKRPPRQQKYYLESHFKPMTKNNQNLLDETAESQLPNLLQKVSQSQHQRYIHQVKLPQKFPTSDKERISPYEINKNVNSNVQGAVSRAQSFSRAKKQEQRQSPNKLPKTHPFNKARFQKDIVPSNSPQSKAINEIYKKLSKGESKQVQSKKRNFLDGVTRLLQKKTDTIIDSTIGSKKAFEPRYPHRKKENVSPKGHEKGFIEIKSIMNKKRKTVGETAKTVVVQQKNYVKEPKNLHKLDIKLEKLIYDNFIERLKIKRKFIREKQLKEKSSIEKQGETISRTTKARSKSVFDIDLDLEEQEEDFILFPVLSDHIESDHGLGLVECSAEDKPNERIIGDRILKLKPKEVAELPVLESAGFHSEEPLKVNFSPPVLCWENPISEFGTSVLDARIFQYELSNPLWITNGWTMLPKQVIVKEIYLYNMVPLERNWFLIHKDKDLFYKSGERLAKIDAEGNGKVFYKNGKIAMEYNCNKDLRPERLVVFSSGEGAYKLAENQPIRKLAVFDHLGSGIIYDAKGRLRLKYNQYEGQKFDADIKGAKQWKFHNLNRKTPLKTRYEEIIDDIGGELDLNKKYKRAASPQSNNENDAILKIEKEIKKKKQESKTYKLYDCELGAIRINKYFVLNILNQRSIMLRFQDAAGVVVNLGMRMISTSLIGFLVSKETEVVTPMDGIMDVHFL